MVGSVLEEKSSFKMLGLSFSFELNWGSHGVSISKTTSKKIGTMIHSMKFHSPKFGLYLYKSTIRSCMEYCCNVWADALSCYSEMLDKLQKRVCMTVGLSLAALFEPLAHRGNVAIPRCYKDVYVNSFFSRTIRFWNFLPIKCFPLNFHLNGFKSRITDTPFICRFFLSYILQNN